MNKIRRIIREEISLLLEREMKNSVDAQIIASMSKNYGFFPVHDLQDNTNYNFLTLYYGGDNSNVSSYETELSNNFRKLSELIERSGWVINQYGGHYDGLRNLYLNYKEKHPEFGVGTFFVNIEKEYGLKMDDYFGNKENELDNYEPYRDEESIQKYGDDKHLGIKYQRGIFYHITSSKNLKPIMAHGLRPKNGGGLTRWRNSSERLYLSLLPDFGEVDFDFYEDEDANVLLKIDLRRVMNNFDFYVDDKYEDAVFTYSPIPPQFIEVMDCKKIYDNYWYNFYIQQTLENVIEYNFGKYSEEVKKEQVETYYNQVYNLVYKKLSTLIQRINLNSSYENTLGDDIVTAMDKYLSN